MFTDFSDGILEGEEKPPTRQSQEASVAVQQWMIAKPSQEVL